MGSPVASPARSVRTRILRGGPLRLLGHAISVGTSVVTVSLALRHLGVERSGVLFSGLSLLALAGAIGDLGLGTAGLRDYGALDAARRSHYLRELLTVRLVLFSVAMSAALAVDAVRRGVDSALFLAAGVLWLGMLLVFSTSLLRLTHELRAAEQALLQSLQAIATLFVTVALIAAGADVGLFFSAPIPGVLLALGLLMGRHGRRGVAWPLRPSGQLVKTIIGRRNVSFGIAAFLAVWMSRSGPFALALLVGSTEAGVYGSAFRIVDVLEGVAPLLMTVVLPVLAGTGVSLAVEQRRIAQVLGVMASLGAVLAVIVYTGSDLLIAVIAGDDFAAAVPVLATLSLVLLLGYPSQLYGYVLLAHAGTRTILLSVVAAFGAATGLTLLLVPALGAQGAAMALVCGQAVILLGYGLGCARLGFTQGHVRMLAWTALAAAAGVAVYSAIPVAVDTEARLLGPAFAGLVTLGLLVATRVLPGRVPARQHD